jgi:hypothetical protein
MSGSSCEATANLHPDTELIGKPFEAEVRKTESIYNGGESRKLGRKESAEEAELLLRDRILLGNKQ